MRSLSNTQVVVTTLLVTIASACGSDKATANSMGSNAAQPTAPRDGGLILAADSGERRIRRNAGKGPFILKIDKKNGGSQDLVMGYEELAPGAEIQLHRHVIADEILFVHRGSGIAFLGTRQSPVTTGATIYIPRNVPIKLQNNGTEPLGVTFVFSKPGFEDLMRDNSVLEGQPVIPLTDKERAEIRERHKWHTLYPPW